MHHIRYTTLFTLYTPACFILQQAILWEYWYSSWAGSTKCVSGC